jgi:GNAT superfamily N-acetyltransferase
MSIRLNRLHIFDPSPNSLPSRSLEYGCKDDVGFARLFRFCHRAFPLAFNRETFQRVYDASDISHTAFRRHSCCRLKIYAAILATSTFDINQKRQLKILMLVEDERSPLAVNIGKRLLTQLIETCKELENIRLIYAFVESNNYDGIKFYTMMGFEQRNVLKNYFSQRASLTPNAIRLEYQISPSIVNESMEHSQTMLSSISTKYNVGD